jgi:hypothetical protein
MIDGYLSLMVNCHESRIYFRQFQDGNVIEIVPNESYIALCDNLIYMQNNVMPDDFLMDMIRNIVLFDIASNRLASICNVDILIVEDGSEVLAAPGYLRLL